jgi:uncharacterized protein
MLAERLPKYLTAVVFLFASYFLVTAALAEIAVPRYESRVTDLTDTLSETQQSVLENRLAAFERQKGSQIAVLIVPTTQPEEIAQYSIRVVEQWKLGRKGVDDGVLMLVAKNDRTSRIEVGYGLEGVIPDAIAKRIIAEIMVPKFRQADYAGGIDAGVDSVIGLIQGEPLPEPQATEIDTNRLNKFFPLLFVLAIAGGFILRAIFGQFLGGLINGGLVGLLVWLLGAGLIFALIAGFMAFLIAQGRGRGGPGGFGGSGYGGGGFSSGGGGGFSGGGGGGFGGGGASGSW